MTLTVVRGGESLELDLRPERVATATGSHGQVGVLPRLPEWPPELITQLRYGPATALVAALDRTGEVSWFTLTSIIKMLQGLISSKNLSGPITIAKLSSSSAKSRFLSYFGSLALLSINL